MEDILGKNVVRRIEKCKLETQNNFDNSKLTHKNLEVAIPTSFTYIKAIRAACSETQKIFPFVKPILDFMVGEIEKITKPVLQDLTVGTSWIYNLITSNFPESI